MEMPDETARRESAQLKARLRQETEEADYRWLMSTVQGRRIVWRMLERAGVFRSSFSSDAMAMAFNEGNRNSGLALLATVSNLSPAEYVEMMKEATNDSAD